MESRLKALRHPVRLRILEHLRLADQASVSELAASLQETSSYICYHVNALVAVDAVRVLGKRTANHRAERIYRLADQQINLSDKNDREKVSEELFAFARQSLNKTRKELEECSQGDELEDAKFIRWVFPADDESMALIEQGLELFRQAASKASGSQSYSFTLALVPLPGQEREPR